MDTQKQPVSRESEPIPEVPSLSPVPSAVLNNPSSNSSSHPYYNSPSAWHKAMLYVVILFVFTIFLPPSEFSKTLSLIFLPIGAIAGIAFIVAAFRTSADYNPIMRLFVVLGSIGIGFVIFIVLLVAAAGLGLAKDPTPARTG